MRRYLLASTALLAIASQAQAKDIDDEVAGPVRTSTINNGAPDSITITKDGSVVSTAGTAVIVDSNHAVTNKGKISVGSGNGSIGIHAQAGTSGDIVNSGNIVVDEAYKPTDEDNDGDKDGPFALGSGRYGIRTEGAHTGDIVNSGTITVQGNDSAGIWLDGPLDGDFVHNGTTQVTGDGSTGVRLDDISGDVRLAGVVSVVGEDSVGARLAGDIDGALVVQGTIGATGYRDTTPPSDTSKFEDDDMLQGGSALVIEGDVSGGILLAVAPANADPDDDDEDSDGIPDAQEGSASIVSFGEAPAMVVGAADRDIAIGGIEGTANEYGIQIDGTVKGIGAYDGVDATGLLIGGRGGAVDIENGIAIRGTVSADSEDANATALHIGAGADAPLLRVNGKVEAKGSADDDTTAIAVRIDEGASLPAIYNAGTIAASAVDEDGNATAIVDHSGSVQLVENSGLISASGAEEDSDRNIAIDLSENTSGATIRQTVVGSGVAAPKIVGDIYLGSGDDMLDLRDGSYEGTARFAQGDNELAISGDARFIGSAIFGDGANNLDLDDKGRFDGTADFGGGTGLLSISDTAVFAGSLVNADDLTVRVWGGALDVVGTASIASLDVSEDGLLIATLDKDDGEGTFYDISGTASFEGGAKIGLRLGDVSDAEGRYVILEAGTLEGADEVELADALIPFLFKASLAEDAEENTLAVDVAFRTASELGLNASQATAFDAVFDAVGEDEEIEDIFLAIADGDQFRGALRQMLPDHAGGTFEGISLGLRTLGRSINESASPVYSFGGLDILVNAAAWSSEKDMGATAAYDLGGMGFSTAAEVDTDLGAFGASLSWLWNDYDQGSDLNVVQSDTYELALYWRGEWGGLSAFGRGSYGFADFSGRRTFIGKLGDKTIQRDAETQWGGSVITASGGVSYEGGGQTFFFRPSLTVDYIRLSEDGHTSTGGGDSMDLTVEERDSDEFAVNGGLTLGLDFTGNGQGDRNWFRIETEGGWREVVGGSLGATTAQFEGGDAFTLDPEDNGGGWYARLRAMGGGDMFDLGGEVGAEDRHGNTAFSLRGTLRMGF